MPLSQQSSIRGRNLQESNLDCDLAVVFEVAGLCQIIVTTIVQLETSMRRLLSMPWAFHLLKITYHKC